MTHRFPSLRIATVLAVLPLLAGCDEAELARLNSALAAAEAHGDKIAAELHSARQESAGKDAELASLRERVLEVDSLEAQVQRLSGAVAREDEAKAKLEEAEDELRMVEGHRDELVEWIVDDLLPLAEQQDPRLKELADNTERMSRAVEEIRGLTFTRPLMRRLIRRDQVGEMALKQLRAEIPEEDARMMVRVMSELGMLSPTQDLYEILTSFLESGAGAFYNPETETFYLIEGFEGAASRPIVFHELVHAVEDQQFSLGDLLKDEDKEGDTVLARRALVEGSADLFQTRYMKAHPEDAKALMEKAMAMAPEQLEMMQKVPTFLIAAMGLYPYKNGSAWLRAIGATTPQDVERLFRDPPESTEQVLHPEKFPLNGEGRDYPRDVEAPELDGLLPDGWEKLETAEMGELMTGMWMVHMSIPGEKSGVARLMAVLDMATQGVLFKPPISLAIEGWDGDRYAAWGAPDEGTVCIVWTSIWDSDDEAAEFAGTFSRILGKKATGKQTKNPPSPVRYTTADGRVTGLDVKGNRVHVVLGAPAEIDIATLLSAAAAAATTPDPRDANDRP